MTAEADRARGEGRRIARNSLLLGAGDSLAMALGFVTTILVTDHLGDDYGIFLGAQRFAGLFLVMAEFGLTPLLVREVAARQGDAGSLFATVAALRAGLCAAFAVLVGGSAEVVAYLPDDRGILWAFVGLSVLSVFASTQMALFEGLERMERSAIVTFTRAAATLAGVAVVVALGGGLAQVVAVYLLGRAVQLVVAVALNARLHIDLRPRVRTDWMAPLMREAPLFVAIGASYTALRSLDVVMLTRMAEPAETARYGAALNFIEVMLPLLLVVQRAMLPAFSRLGAQAASEDVVRDAMLAFSALLVPSAIGLSLLAESAVALYPSGEFAHAAPVLRVLGLSLLFLGHVTICATYLTGIGRMWSILRAYAVALPVQVVANAVLIPLGGALGLSVATLVAQATLCGVLFWVVAAQGVTVPLAAFGRHLAVGAVMGAVVYATRSLPLPVPIGAGALTYGLLLAAVSGSGSLERRVLRAGLAWWRSR